MQNRVSLLIIFMAAMLCGCQKSQVDQQLDHAESIIEEHPDSALTILQQIDGTTLHGEPQARHALLLSQAYDKNYIDLTNDSLISIAVNYYKESENNLHKTLSYHYLAVVNKNAGHYGSALQCALTAHDEAINMIDPLNTSRIESVIARIYVMGGDFREALRWETMSLENAKRVNNHEWVEEGYVNMGEDLMATMRFKEAILYADSAVAISNMPSQDALEIKYLSYYGMDMRQQADSIYYILTSLGFHPSESIETTRSDIGTQGLQEAVSYQKYIIEAQNNCIYELISNNLAEALHEYNAHKTDLLNIKIKEKETRIVVFSVIGLLTITILVLIIIILRLRNHNTHIEAENAIHSLYADCEKLQKEVLANQNEITQLHQNIERLSQQSAHTEQAYCCLKHEISVAFLHKFSWINKLGALYLDANLSGDKSEHILYKKVSEEICISKRTPFISIIENGCKEQYNSLLSEMSAINLIRSEKEMLLFFMAGVSTRVISYITDKSPASIYSIKNRIKNKLQEANTPFSQYIYTII